MSATASIPGLYYAFVHPPRTPSPLRTDVAGFFGRTARGPVGAAIRVEGWREYFSIFGGLTADASTPYAVSGYFENKASAAYIVRLLGGKSQCAAGRWIVGTYDAASKTLNADWPGAGGLPALSFTIQASSQGTWANKTSITVRYWQDGTGGKPEIEFQVKPPNDHAEILSGLDPASVHDAVNAQSAYIRLSPDPLPEGVTAPLLAGAPPGPRYFEWNVGSLSGGTSVAPDRADYLNAVQLLGDEIEVALMLSPDLYHPDFSVASDQTDVLGAMLTQAEALHDRLVIIDVPPQYADALSAVRWVDTSLRTQFDEDILRNGTVYHPRLKIPDPLGGLISPLRCAPCSGWVTGVISQLDLQFGAYFTPANEGILQAIDLSSLFDAEDQADLYSGGINLLTCTPGRGLLVWGGRVLGKQSPGGFVAHRRLIHLLVRAIRRVAEPLVFDTNGPELWLAFVRSVNTVLLQAYRAGALKGDQPNQAFQVICDSTTNPQAQIDQGIVVCIVKVAPAVPMEFITLRVAVSAEGQLEVFEK